MCVCVRVSQTEYLDILEQTVMASDLLAWQLHPDPGGDQQTLGEPVVIQFQSESGGVNIHRVDVNPVSTPVNRFLTH